MIFVCPLPRMWIEIVRSMKRELVASGKPYTPPPPLLIFGGWSDSSDHQKAQRWRDTIDWAKSHHVEHLIPELTAEESLIVYGLRSPRPDPRELWHYDPRPKPSREQTEEALRKLKAEWERTIEPHLASLTTPLSFTGRKMRRLVVKADFSSDPPWGSWTSISNRDQRGTFTQLRKAVNEAIRPLEVDHIEFCS
jgi:hypothetical protein